MLSLGGAGPGRESEGQPGGGKIDAPTARHEFPNNPSSGAPKTIGRCTCGQLLGWTA
jgi:hypothetical protein